jgi:hypothetical protein
MNNAQISNKTITEQQKHEFIKMRKKRNLAIGLALGGFILMLYFVTIFKLGSQLFV